MESQSKIEAPDGDLGYYDIAGPSPVVVVVSRNPNDEIFNQAPFSWIFPMSKTFQFGIMMRFGSRTLKNIISTYKQGGAVVGVNRLAVDQAQRIRLMKGPERPFKFPLDEDDPYRLKEAVAFMKARVDVKVGFLASDTHFLVPFKTFEGGVYEDQPFLQFTNFRTFFTAEPFEVEGF